jgi:hypothetical protein
MMLSSFTLRGLFRLFGGPTATIEGFSIYCGFLPETEESYLANLREALLLVRRVDPVLFARIRRDVPGFYISTLGGASYQEPLRMIWLDGAALLGISSEQTAALIVHEGAHARHNRCGIRSWPDLRPRLERFAVGQQIRFLHRLPRDEFPRADEHIRWARTCLETPWWTLDQRLKRYYRANWGRSDSHSPAASEPIAGADAPRRSA